MTRRSAVSAVEAGVRCLGRSVRWNWVLAVTLGTLLGLLVATWLGETGATLGGADPSDQDEALTTRAPR